MHTIFIYAPSCHSISNDMSLSSGIVANALGCSRGLLARLVPVRRMPTSYPLSPQKASSRAVWRLCTLLLISHTLYKCKGRKHIIIRRGILEEREKPRTEVVVLLLLCQSRHLRLISLQTGISAKADWAEEAEALLSSQPSSTISATSPILPPNTLRPLQHPATRAHFSVHNRRIRLHAPCRSSSKRRR